MIELLMAGVLLTTAAPLPPDQELQVAPAPQDPAGRAPSVELEDVVVTGRSLDTVINNFVRNVAEPNRGRGLARWDRSVCVGVANLTGEAAEYIADRVSTVAADIGLEVGRPLAGRLSFQPGLGLPLDHPVAGVEQPIAPLNQDAINVRGG